jgi:hypothetical protein
VRADSPPIGGPADGELSNKQIARELHLSIHTVKNHFHSIFEKLNVEDRLAAVRLAARQGLLGESITTQTPKTEDRKAAVRRMVSSGFAG